MTEEEWRGETNPLLMLSRWAPNQAERKLRLYAVACCRTMHISMREADTTCTAIDAAERYADGTASETELQTARDAVPKPLVDDYGASWNPTIFACSTKISKDVWGAAFHSAASHTAMIADVPDQDELIEKSNEQNGRVVCELFRCIFGNPFRPVAFPPSWRSETAVALAAGIYEERAFDRLPILADAFEEAGCDQPDVLSHCRGPGPHARGCWVVDGVLGKE